MNVIDLLTCMSTVCNKWRKKTMYREYSWVCLWSPNFEERKKKFCCCWGCCCWMYFVSVEKTVAFSAINNFISHFHSKIYPPINDQFIVSLCFLDFFRFSFLFTFFFFLLIRFMNKVKKNPKIKYFSLRNQRSLWRLCLSPTKAKGRESIFHTYN